jgi:hypothetical protein
VSLYVCLLDNQLNDAYKGLTGKLYFVGWNDLGVAAENTGTDVLLQINYLVLKSVPASVTIMLLFCVCSHERL